MGDHHAHLVVTLICLLALVAGTRLILSRHARICLRRGVLSRYVEIADVLPFRTPGRRRLEIARGLFWQGKFEPSLEVLQGIRIHHRALRFRADHARLTTLNLVLLDRTDEARALPEQSIHWRRSSPNGRAVDEVIAGLIAYFDDELVAARIAMTTALSADDPVKKLAHYLLAVLDEESGDPAAAQQHLEAALDHGGELFFVIHAIERHRRLFARPPGAGAAPAVPDPAGERHAATNRELVTASFAFSLGEMTHRLACGFRLVLFRKFTLPDLDPSPEQLALLFATNVFFSVLPLLLEYTRRADFWLTGAYAAVGWIAGVLPFAYVLAKIVGRTGSTMRIAALLLAVAPLLRIAAYFLQLKMGPLELLVVAWTAAVIVRIVRLMRPMRSRLRSVLAFWVYVSLALPAVAQTSRGRVWFARANYDQVELDFHRLPRVLEAQPEKLRQSQSLLLPGRAGVSDMYFVGFAGWGGQDVFVNEIASARALFDRRFDTQGRSILLGNLDDEPYLLPVASKASLESTLRHVGSLMDPEEDVLFLFLSSHGSAESMGVQLFDTALSPIKPHELRQALDAARIKWRVLVISACESGGFVDALKNSQSLVATAAAADRKSFGCKSGRQFTEYGRAVFGEQLAEQTSFVAAFEKAGEVIAARERAVGLTASRPQLVVGEAMARKLRELESRWSAND